MPKYTTWTKLARPIIQFLWPVQIIDRHKFVEGKGVYICNHYSVFDSNHFVATLFHDRLNALVKKESMDSYIGKKFLGYVGCIPVNRQELDVRAVKQCLTVLREGKPLLIFPEGTRNKSGNKEMLEMKDGAVVFALKTKSNIYPFMYSRPIKFFRKTWLIVGDKIDLSEYFDRPAKDVKDEVMELVKKRMVDLRMDLDEITSDKAKIRQAKRNDRETVKAYKKANREAKKQSRLARKDAKTAKIEE